VAVPQHTYCAGLSIAKLQIGGIADPARGMGLKPYQHVAAWLLRHRDVAGSHDPQVLGRDLREDLAEPT
jgi:hypothetical protein